MAATGARKPLNTGQAPNGKQISHFWRNHWSATRKMLDLSTPRVAGKVFVCVPGRSGAPNRPFLLFTTIIRCDKMGGEIGRGRPDRMLAASGAWRNAGSRRGPNAVFSVLLRFRRGRYQGELGCLRELVKADALYVWARILLGRLESTKGRDATFASVTCEFHHTVCLAPYASTTTLCVGEAVRWEGTRNVPRRGGVPQRVEADAECPTGPRVVLFLDFCFRSVLFLPNFARAYWRLN